jgi:hypothetical protein
LWRQRIHNLRAPQIELPVAVQFAPVTARHAFLNQRFGEPVQ